MQLMCHNVQIIIIITAIIVRTTSKKVKMNSGHSRDVVKQSLRKCPEDFNLMKVIKSPRLCDTCLSLNHHNIHS